MQSQRTTPELPATLQTFILARALEMTYSGMWGLHRFAPRGHSIRGGIHPIQIPYWAVSCSAPSFQAMSFSASLKARLPLSFLTQGLPIILVCSFHLFGNLENLYCQPWWTGCQILRPLPCAYHHRLLYWQPSLLQYIHAHCRGLQQLLGILLHWDGFNILKGASP